jgi:hypothetical protein
MGQLLNALGVGLAVAAILGLAYMRQRAVSRAPDRQALSEAYWRITRFFAVAAVVLLLLLIVVLLLERW